MDCTDEKKLLEQLTLLTFLAHVNVDNTMHHLDSVLTASLDHVTSSVRKDSPLPEAVVRLQESCFAPSVASENHI